MIFRHDPAFTKEQVEQILATPRQWFETGSFLYRDALRARAVLDDLPAHESTIVGKGVSIFIDHAGLTRSRQEGIAAMLFAFAVECWLKGLAILNKYNNICQVETPIKQALKIALLGWNEDDGENLVATIDRFLESEEGQKVLAQTRLEKASVMVGVNELLNRHSHHDLVQLAHDAGLKLSISPENKDFLKLLSSMNMQGRYPCHWKPDRVMPWAGVAGDSERWSALCDEIYKCYKEHEHLLV